MSPPKIQSWTSNKVQFLGSDFWGPILSVVKKIKGRPRMPKNRTSKIQGDVEAFKKGYLGGNIEGVHKKVDLEKILSQTYLNRLFLKLHI
jgi:hypothetical protein